MENMKSRARQHQKKHLSTRCLSVNLQVYMKKEKKKKNQPIEMKNSMWVHSMKLYFPFFQVILEKCFI